MTLDDLFRERIRKATSLGELATELEGLLSGGFVVYPGGMLGGTRQLVDRVKGLRIEVYPNEHPPPHFHVKGGGVDATFSITDCTLLTGSPKRRDFEMVQWWHQSAREHLIKTWNATRPTNCPVGPIKL